MPEFDARVLFDQISEPLRLMKVAIKRGMLAKLSKYRIKREIILIMKEKGGNPALEHLEELGAGIIRTRKL